MIIIDESLQFWRKNAKPVALNSQEILFQQGEPAKNLFWLETGKIKLVSFTKSQLIFHYWVSAGELFAETVLFEPTYGCTAITIQPSSIIPIDRNEFLSALSKSEALNHCYLAHVTKRFADVKQLLTLRSIYSARDRLLHYLLQQRLPGNNRVSLPNSLKELALELGISPEALSRTFAQIESEGIIQRKRGSITIDDGWLKS